MTASVTDSGSIFFLCLNALVPFLASVSNFFIFLLQGSELVQGQAVVRWIGRDDPRELRYGVLTPRPDHHGNQGCRQTSFHAVSWAGNFRSRGVLSKETPTIVLCSWFHGKITREEAERLLTPPKNGLFLVRESSAYKGDYTLCVWSVKRKPLAFYC